MQIIVLIALLASFVTPEQFGAPADGAGDDAPAFNACIRSGLPMSLKKDKTYILRSRLERISGNSFVLDGNGATLVIDSSYPVLASDCLFAFENDYDSRDVFKVKNLYIKSYLGPKFTDASRRGDTYVFYVGNCAKAEFRNVDFEDFGRYNNLSFIVNAGANMSLRDCRIVSHSRSVQGGALWLMNKYREQLRLSLRNVDIDYDTHDECLCVAVDAASELSDMKLRAKISSCNFRSASSVDNPGFVILYCHSDRIVPDIEAVFRHCSFVTEKGLPKRILAFQSTRSPAVPDNHIAASFNRCSFVNKPAVYSDTGLFWMPHKTPQTRPEQYLMRFVKSSIEASNVCSVIGDKDGETCGTLEFRACDVRTDGELFVRRYNPGAGNLHIRAIASVMQCSGKYVTTETIEARRTSFVSDFVSEMEMTKSNP